MREGGRDAETEVTSDAPAIAADRRYLPSVTDLMSKGVLRAEAAPRQPRHRRRIPGVADYLAEFTGDPRVARRNNLLSGRVGEVFHMTKVTVFSPRGALAPPGATAGLGHVLRGFAHRLSVFAQVMQVLLHPQQVRVGQLRSRRRAVGRARAGR